MHRDHRGRGRDHDAAGNEIIRHGRPNFLGELNLLSGQTALVTAIAVQPVRYIALDRDAFRSLLFEDGPLSDSVLSAFIARRELLQRVHGIGLEILGPRSSQATMRMLGFARSNRLPFTWRDPERSGDPSVAALFADLKPRAVRWCACRAARSCHGPGLTGARDRPRALGQGVGRADGA